MKIITQESLAETLIENVLRDLRKEYVQRVANGQKIESFDTWLWNSKLGDLGQAFYEVVGDFYGDEIPL